MTIDDVRLWMWGAGNIWHAVATSDGTYHTTACGVFANHRSMTKMPDRKRICRACRNALPYCKKDDQCAANTQHPV